MKPKHDELLKSLATSLGPHIGELILNPEIIEIMLNPDGKLWADSIKTGRFYTNINISPKDSLMTIQYIAGAYNAECHEKNPIISAEMPGTGSRFQGMIPPIVRQPTFTIRKKAIQVFTLNQYVASGIMTIKQQLTIIEAVKKKKNILVIGSTGAGKTTLCNAILDEIAKTDSRIVIIEDTQELQCNAPDTVSIKSNEENVKTNMETAL
jgi:type IV secretion system protein VirB11